MAHVIGDQVYFQRSLINKRTLIIPKFVANICVVAYSRGEMKFYSPGVTATLWRSDMGTIKYAVRLQTLRENSGTGEDLSYLRQRRATHHICALSPLSLHDSGLLKAPDFKRRTNKMKRPSQNKAEQRRVV